jgi:hypothetical protein
VSKIWFLSLWHVLHKPCTDLAPTLTLSLNGLKRDSTWPTSTRSSIGCVPKQFSSLWYVRRKSCTNLASRLALSPNGPNQASTKPRLLGVPPGGSKKQFMSLWCVWRKLCTYLAPILTLPPNGQKRHSTWPTSPRSSTGCVQNNIRAYSTYGASRAPILRQD